MMRPHSRKTELQKASTSTRPAGATLSEGTWGSIEAGRRILADTELMLALLVLRRSLADL